MKKMKKTAAFLLAAALGITCTGCGTTVAENTRLYFSNSATVWNNLTSSGKTPEKKEIQNTENTGAKLEAPKDLAVTEDGSYSFTGVENADYYLIYFCDPEAVNDEDTYIYSSEPIEANDSNQYNGRFEDAFRYRFGEYLVKVFAFPKLMDTEHEMSTAASASYTFRGNQSAPELYYYWNTFTGVMGVQVANLGTYEFEAYPQKVDVTFTNTEKADDVVTVTISDVSPASFGAETDALTRGATYQITAVASNDSEFVLNPTSDVAEIAAVTAGDNHAFTLGYSYSDGFANNIFNWPVLGENFNLAEGGVAGQTMGWRGPGDYVCTPTDANGAAYRYELAIQGGFDVKGTLTLNADGTFQMEETGGGPVNASTIDGTWTDNGDGTATLNYDHSKIVIN